MTNRHSLLLLAALSLPTLGAAPPPDHSQGRALYQKACASCHENPDMRTPEPSALEAMSAELLMSSLTQGKMKDQAAGLNRRERRDLVRYLTRNTDNSSAWEQDIACDSDYAAISGRSMMVRGWGYDTHNSRHQPAEFAGLEAKDLPGLELAWAHGFPGTTEMRTQPVLTDTTVYVGVSGTQSVYAFDLASGCLRWAHRSPAPIRSALAYDQYPDGRLPVLYYGSVDGSVTLVNATDGSTLWSKSVKLDATTTLTGTPVQYGGKLYVPLSNFEVGAARRPGYECCKGRGGVTALDMKTGDTLWTWHSTAAAENTGKKNSAGTPLWGPSGAPVWTTPAIDEKRNVLYIGTGENYSQPATDTSDAIIALDLNTGEEVWKFQALVGDAYNMDCSSWMMGKDGPNCPQNSGPDFDFGASVIIARDNEGKDILLAGQKSGDVWALDPDKKGAVRWQTNLSNGTPVGGVHWGMAAVGDTLFVPIADPEWPISGWSYKPQPGVSALDISTGKIKWQYRASRDCKLNASDFVDGRHKEKWPQCHYMYGFSGAALGLDDVVLAGALNGKLFAFDPEDGAVLWTYDSKRPYQTLNGVEAHGGALDNAGYAVGGGHLVLQSGYSYINQMPGNVLLVLRANNENK
jgi:polyvinyl alcohol dehydrogenase (cytochrome)